MPVIGFCNVIVQSGPMTAGFLPSQSPPHHFFGVIKASTKKALLLIFGLVYFTLKVSLFGSMCRTGLSLAHWPSVSSDVISLCVKNSRAEMARLHSGQVDLKPSETW